MIFSKNDFLKLYDIISINSENEIDRIPVEYCSHEEIVSIKKRFFINMRNRNDGEFIRVEVSEKTAQKNYEIFFKKS